MLHVIKRLSQNYPVAIKATLCAHAFPLEYKDNHQGYIDMLIDEIIPEIAKHELAQYIDVFESGYFTVAETEQIMKGN
jgi:imidazolonepropionase